MTGRRRPAAAHLHRIGHFTRLRIPPNLLHQVKRGGPLESPWLAAGLAALLVTSVALAVGKMRLARRRVRRTLDAATGIALLGFSARLAAD